MQTQYKQLKKKIAFGHLHIRINRKMKKVGNFKTKKLKIAFRVLNNSARAAKISLRATFGPRAALWPCLVYTVRTTECPMIWLCFPRLLPIFLKI